MVIFLILLASAVAIAALVGLNASIGGWTPARFESVAAAIARIAEENHDFKPDEASAVLSADARLALCAERDGARIGLAVARGDGVATRVIAPGGLRRVIPRGAKGLRIQLHDLTLPGVRVSFISEEAARDWAERLARLETAR